LVYELTGVHLFDRQFDLHFGGEFDGVDLFENALGQLGEFTGFLFGGEREGLGKVLDIVAACLKPSFFSF
jgi:hypothetical protein